MVEFVGDLFGEEYVLFVEFVVFFVVWLDW